MTIQPVKVQPSQIWHVKQCRSKVHSKKTPCAQIKQDHSFTKKSHEHKTEKSLIQKVFYILFRQSKIFIVYFHKIAKIKTFGPCCCDHFSMYVILNVK